MRALGWHHYADRLGAAHSMNRGWIAGSIYCARYLESGLYCSGLEGAGLVDGFRRFALR